MWRAHPELLRACLVPLFVLLCYLFDWAAWRTLTCDVFLGAAHWIGIPAVRLAPLPLLWMGTFTGS